MFNDKEMESTSKTTKTIALAKEVIALQNAHIAYLNDQKLPEPKGVPKPTELDYTHAKAASLQVRKDLVEAKTIPDQHATNLPEPKLLILSIPDKVKEAIVPLIEYATSREIPTYDLQSLYRQEDEILRQRIDRVWINAMARNNGEEASTAYRLSGLGSEYLVETNMTIYKLDQLRLDCGIAYGDLPKERESIFVNSNPKNAIIADISNYHIVESPSQVYEINSAFLQQFTYELGAYNDLIKILQAKPVPTEFNLAAIPNFNISDFPHAQIAQHVSAEQFAQNIHKISPDPQVQTQLLQAHSSYHSAQAPSSIPSNVAASSSQHALSFATIFGQKAATSLSNISPERT